MKHWSVLTRVDIQKFFNNARFSWWKPTNNNKLFDKPICDPFLKTFIHAWKIVDSITFRLSQQIRRMLQNVLNGRLENSKESKQKWNADKADGIRL